MWLNLRMDDHHFGYITKLTQKNNNIAPQLLSNNSTK